MDTMHRAVRLLSALHLARRRPPRKLGDARRRDRRVTARWGWSSHIRGIGAGFKRVRGTPDLATPCLTIYVRRKLPLDRVPANERVPPRLHLATLGREIVTDIIEVRHPIVAHAAPGIQPGMEVAHEYGDPGTLALLVRKGRAAAVRAASCSHVLARSGVQAAEGDLVEHPPMYSGDHRANEFGRLTDTFTRLDTAGTCSEDFALATIDVPYLAMLATNQRVIDTVADSSAGFSPDLPTRLQGVRDPDVSGHVLNPSWTGIVDDVPFVGGVHFRGLVPYSTACRPGDSGAAVLEQGTNTVLGLHVGGSTQDDFGLFMPLWPIFEELDLKLVTA